MSDTLYKALKSDGRSPYQDHEWPLPSENGNGYHPGEWVDAGEGELEECAHGIHACTLDQLPGWLNDRLYVLEPAEGADRLDGDDKTVLRRARLVRPVETWDETTARLYAADCAETVLPLWEAEHPDDDRPRKAIEAARAYALGEIDRDELSAAWYATGSAARSATGSAAWYAAWYATGSAARDATWYATGSAARYATGSATGSAAWYAAWYAAREWQADRLGLYLERGPEARHEPIPDIHEMIEEAT